ncbi:MAG: leucyl aminopeptidase [Candidatus Aenigmarchaeota archaeon]|nr:leucyl aminopeptidase [Candidatus Aenigmarchaeota archaeon]
MNVKVEESDIFTYEGECIVLGCFETDRKHLAVLDKKFDGRISSLFKRKEFTGELFQLWLLNTLRKIPAENILLVGLGKKEEFDAEKLRKASGHAAKFLREAGVKVFATVLHHSEVTGASVRFLAQTVTEGAVLANYKFVEYKTVDRDKIRFVDSVVLLASKNKKDVESGVNEAVVVSKAQCWVRDLVNSPPSILTPENLVAAAHLLPKSVKVTVFDKKRIKELGMGGILAVNAGSSLDPKFIVAEYKNSSDAPIALVGKGVTFDSGGLSLKPAQYMEDMKMDMAGAGVVLGVLKAIAELKLPVHVIGFAPLTENMPSGLSYKPGDIVTTFSKKTIEVLNTDAEGRVILADALAFAETKNPQAIIDLATLTGACIVALGTAAAGLTGNNHSLMDKVARAGDAVFERCWHLPLFDEYKEMVKSDVADLRNLGRPDKEAGALTAAAFLSAFVEKTPWAHIDIAGPAWSQEDKFYWSKGGTGFGVRLLVELLKSWKKNL